MKTFELLESQVRTYSRAFPVVFTKAKGCRLTDEHGKDYLDFFSGAGALNYGHNDPRMKRRLLEYLAADGVTHSLDMATIAKQEFLEKFNAVILEPRNLEYKVQFTGPTGTDAVEAALKLARKFAGRRNIIHFVNAFHGMSLGALAITGSVSRRASAGVPLHHTLPMFFDGDLGPSVDTLEYLEAFLDNQGTGIELPAAVIVETIQAEGGVKVASNQWLRRLEQITRRRGILLIVDDIQVGCGRTGDFFSFEESGIKPDIVCLSKSISGYGLPMSLALIRPEIDIWRPGEHTGTFRGNNLAFVTATEALAYWQDDSFRKDIAEKSRQAVALLRQLSERDMETRAYVRGRGLIQALVFAEADTAKNVSRAAFDRGVIIETCGPKDEAIKLLPPLTISREELELGISIIAESVRAVQEDASVRVAWDDLPGPMQGFARNPSDPI
jgi:diaminobutyrate-2-oxoglutarate transaminase